MALPEIDKGLDALPEGFVVEQTDGGNDSGLDELPEGFVIEGTEAPRNVQAEEEPSIWEKVKRGANAILNMVAPGIDEFGEKLSETRGIKEFEKKMSEYTGEPEQVIWRPPEKSENQVRADRIRARLQNIEMLYSDLVDMARGALGNEEAAKQYAEKVLQMNKNLVDVLNDAGIRSYLTTEGIMYEDENGKVHNLEEDSTIAEDLLVSAGEITGGTGGAVAGAAAGARYAPGATKIPAMLIGGMIGEYLGSGAGKAIDVIRNASEINRQVKNSEVLRSALDAAQAATVAGMGVSVGAKVLGPAVKKPFKYIVDLAKSDGSGSIDYVIKEAGLNPEAVSKTADEMNRLAKPEGQTGRIEAIQDKGLAAAMTEQSLLPDLIEAIKQDAKAAQNLSQTIAGRAEHLEKELKSKSISAKELQGKIDNYIKRTQDFYSGVQETWKKAFEGYGFEVDNIAIPKAKEIFKDLQSIESPTIYDVIEQLKKDIQKPDVVAELEGLKNRIQGQHGIEDIFELRRELGRISRLPSVKAYKGQKALEAYIEAVDDRIAKLPEQIGLPEKVAKQMTRMYDEANAEYAKMKRMTDSYAYKKLTSPGMTEKKYRSTLKDLSESVNSELEDIFDKLPKRDGTRARAEISLLYSHVDKALKTTKTKNKAVDFEALKKSLNEINEDLLKTPEAKNALKIMRKDADLFRNDYVLQQIAGGVNERVANNIATELMGKINMYVKSKMFKELQKKLPNRRGAHLAFQANLARALERSRTPADFIIEIEQKKLLDRDKIKDLKKLLKSYEEKMAKTKKSVEEMTLEQVAERLDEIKPDSTDIGNYLASIKERDVFPERLPDAEADDLRRFALERGERGVSELLAKRKGPQHDPYYLAIPEPKKYDKYDIGITKKERAEANILPANKIEKQVETAEEIVASEPIKKADLNELAERLRMTDKEDVEKALKVPYVEIRRINPRNQREEFNKIVNAIKEQPTGTSKERIVLSDAEFEEYEKLAKNIFGTFQGGKQDMARIVPQIVKQVFSPAERKAIDTINDWFGGGGSWGIFMASTDLFPNLKTINLYEYSPARMLKIKTIQNRSDEVAKFIRSDRFRKLLKAAMMIEYEKGNKGSIGNISKQIASHLTEKTNGYTETEMAALVYFIDYGLTGRQVLTDPNALIETIAKQIENIGKAVDNLKQRGIAIKYHTGDSYAFPKEAGFNQLDLVDPPYYKTTGYTYFDIETGEVRKAGMVDRDIYEKTAQLIKELDEKGHSIIYTDEAWWLKKQNLDGTELRPDANGKNSYDLTMDIIEHEDIFMKVPIAGRVETLGIKNNLKGKVHEAPSEFGKQYERGGAGRNATEPAASDRNDADGGGGGNSAERMGNRADDDNADGQMGYTAEKEAGQMDEHGAGGKQEAGITQEEIDAIKNNPPTAEEARVMERLGPKDKYGTFAQDIRYIREGRATDAQIERYIRAKKSIPRETFEAELEREKAPKSLEDVEREYADLDLRQYLQDRAQTDARRDPYEFILKPKEAKAILEGRADGEVLKKLAEDAKYIETNDLWKETYAIPLSSPAAGGALLGGMAGVDIDENGNITVDPERFVAGLLAGAAGGGMLMKLGTPAGRMKVATALKKIAEVNKDAAILAAEKIKEKYPMLDLRAFAVDGGQVHKSMPMWKSKLEEVLGEIKQDKMTSAQARGLLKKAGVKDEELEWSGVDEYLKSHNKVTKQELLDVARANRLEVNEIVRQGNKNKVEITENGDGYDIIPYDGNGEPIAVYQIWKEDENGNTIYVLYDEINDIDIGKYKTLDEAKEAALQKIGTYEVIHDGDNAEVVTDNGAILIKLADAGFIWENYDKTTGEWLASYETKQQAIEAAKQILLKDDYMPPSRYGNYVLPGEKENYRELLLQLPREEGPTYTKFSHWTEPNIVAFARLDERNTAEGKKALFVEEIQSDWHQEGRKKGYVNVEKINNDIENLKRLENEYRKNIEDMEKNAIKMMEDISAEYARNIKKGLSAEEAAKKMVTVVDKYNKTKEIQDELNKKWREIKSELSKKILELEDGIPDAPFKKDWPLLAMKRIIQEAVENGDDAVMWTTGKQQADRYDLRKQLKTLRVTRNGDAYELYGVTPDGIGVDLGKDIPQEKLADYVGKEMAEKIVNGENKLPRGNIQEFTGIDLAVGGKGMEEFYDKILPKTVDKYIRKYGSKVKRMRLDNSETVWGFEITPKMRREVSAKGQYLYAQGAGALYGVDVQTDENGQVTGVRVDPEKMLLGFVAGAMGMKAFERISVKASYEEKIRALQQELKRIPKKRIEKFDRSQREIYEFLLGKRPSVWLEGADGTMVMLEKGDRKKGMKHIVDRHYGKGELSATDIVSMGRHAKLGRRMSMAEIEEALRRAGKDPAEAKDTIGYQREMGDGRIYKIVVHKDRSRGGIPAVTTYYRRD